MDWKRVALLAVCVAGIYGAYLTQGIVNERLQTSTYGPDGEHFRHMEGLNGAQALAGFVVAWLLVQLLNSDQQEGASRSIPWYLYWLPAVTNSFGPACGMIALRNISYPAQVLAKSSKMVPVMLMGTVLHHKRYSALEYTCMSLVGLGVALFARRSSNKVTSRLAAPNAPLGYGLCVMNLVLDGYTNAAQDELLKHYPQTTPLHMMCWMNFWTLIYYGIYMFLYGTTGRELIAFCRRHPDAGAVVVLFCVCGALGQLFIFFTIKTFGSLVNTLVCTTRKFFNILGSVLYNGNPLLPVQWAGVCMVFTGLITSTVAKSRSRGSRHGHGGGAGAGVGAATGVAAAGAATAVEDKKEQ